jgi:hypothetical protein
MGYAARILADSISELGARLTTFEVTFPRIVLAEFNTHRMLSRNSASSRAIPVEKRIAMVEADPFVPEAFGKNQKGMQASEELGADDTERAHENWALACEAACEYAKRLASLGVHKQLANRLLEPFLWHTVIVTGTEWSNFFALRCHKDAQPEIRKPAIMMRELYDAGYPTLVRDNGWHRPLCDDVGDLRATAFTEDEINLVCIGRIARISFLTHDGRRDPDADLELSTKRLLPSGHMSPFEHVARPVTLADDAAYRLGAPHEEDLWTGNFRGWFQYRKGIKNEHDFSKVQRS